MEWELSKENVQPLRKGRKVEVLNETLRAKEESPAAPKICERQRRFNYAASRNRFDHILLLRSVNISGNVNGILSTLK